eukprot:CAMPEP_0198269308 /NCGR_PEP_ID=MMETSP1447-20131203/40848_1 /TAXON_ID=420782 /ORGANISM="Chaetoceros dichaeta, Strain CCMP1751" /LENGTH=68 /DNA_ID=CAMNT_0043960847 /DNA_START=36 /DNA_END=238 /DNA_ORIENTATION=+
MTPPPHSQVKSEVASTEDWMTVLDNFLDNDNENDHHENSNMNGTERHHPSSGTTATPTHANASTAAST